MTGEGIVSVSASGSKPGVARTTQRPVLVTSPMMAASSSHFLQISMTRASLPGFATRSMRSCDSLRSIS